ncbi:MAG: hypothetical protein M3305_00360 [Actinomycetota bacterium]|nr:hypothetical protein [Actinomycetota bacterium]
MAAARNMDPLTLLEDRHMWRLLLAKLHPDAGGDHELFLFACAMKEKIHNGERRGSRSARNDHERKAQRPAEHFLKVWQEAMNGWALSNREAVRSCRT